MKAVNSYRRHNPGNAKKRLIGWLLAFFAGIALPVYFLLDKVYSQLENEIWFRQRNQAELLVERIERDLLAKLQPEQDRAIAEYSFFNVLENPLLRAATVNFSPLSELPPKSDIPGLVGYFQIDPNGDFQIPALPEFTTDLNSGLSPEALAVRIALKDKLRALLASNVTDDEQAEVESRQAGAKVSKDAVRVDRFDEYFQDADRGKADAGVSTAHKKEAADASDQVAALKKSEPLSEEKLQQLNIETKLWKQQRKGPETGAYEKNKNRNDYRQQLRKETVRIPDQSLAGALLQRSRPAPMAAAESSFLQRESPIGRSEQEQAEPSINERVAVDQQTPVNILSFESEVSPLQLIRLGGGYLCFYRNAWSGKARYVQGLIVDEQFLQKIIQPVLDSLDDLPLSSLLIVDRGRVMQRFRQAASETEVLLYRRTLLSPFQQLELIVNSGSLEAGAGRRVLDIVSIALALIVVGGFVLFYRLGASQIELAKQQRNFISSVSHELKTPLTSIRMYSEMLRADWVTDPARKRGYYDYIYFESERLSRLISNVLQLARLDNHPKKIHPVAVDAGQLLQQVKAKVAAQIEAADYRLTLIPPNNGADHSVVQVDEDAFVQIMINLVDNAIKFSRRSDNRRIDIGYRTGGKGKELVFYVRDYGPGVEKEQMKKIFKLFYRAGDELTRTQPGTGIGLALVVQLAESMGAVVDLVNRFPGAEFQVKF
ncbi:MAG: sensor histidine kinase, partial [Gammaproteobacteria bacterium]